MQRLGVEGRLVIAFTMAGGMLVSGQLVASAALSGKISLSAALPATWLVFGVGAVLGWAHAVLLGYVGRQDGTSRRSVVYRMLLGGACSVPGLLIALIAASGMTLSGILVRSGGVIVWLGAALCWLVGAAICAWAITVGVEAYRNACVRFQEFRTGAPLLAAFLLTLAILFNWSRPEIWGTEYRVTATGAAFLAFGATIWIAAPIVLLLLHLVHRYKAQHRVGK